MRTRLDLDFQKGALTLKSVTGFRIVGSLPRIETNRGRSVPGSTRQRPGLKHEFHTRRLTVHAVEFWQTIHNQDSLPLKIREIVMLAGRLSVEGRGWRVMHPELFLADHHVIGNLFHFTDGLFGPLPGTSGRFGLSEDMPFPGLFFTHPERGTLLLATLSQERCKPCFELDGLQLRATDAFQGIPAIPVKAGAEFETERWVVIWHPDGIHEVIDEYYRLLKQRYRFMGRDSVLREEIVWTSYNFNPRPRGEHDIDHAYIAANARAMRRILRKPCWVGIDVGYGYGYAKEKIIERVRIGPTRGPDMFYPGVKTPHDPKLFSRGMRAVVNDIHKVGSKPALWFPPCIFYRSKMALENPEWIFPEMTEPAYPHGWGRGGAYLDYSIPEVREHLRRSWEVIFGEWGFMGLKLDFWYNMFEINGTKYRNTDKTAIELRNMMFAEIRSFVPKGGYIMACHNTTGNPFLGRYVDACRMGPDAGNEWRITHRAAVWMTRSAPFFRNDCLLADGEGFLWNYHLPIHEQRTGTTLALMAGAMVELAGDLTRVPREGAEMIYRYGQLFGRSRKNWSNVFEHSTNNMPASDWRLIKENGDVYEAKFNWLDHHPRDVHFAKSVTDLWTGKRLSGTQQIAPRGVLLFKR